MWVADVDESASSIDFDTLNARLRVMAECRNVVPEKALPYSTVEHVIESRNIAKRYKLPEAAVTLIEKAGPIHGQQSRTIQVAVELLWNMPGWGVF